MNTKKMLGLGLVVVFLVSSFMIVSAESFRWDVDSTATGTLTTTTNGVIIVRNPDGAGGPHLTGNAACTKNGYTGCNKVLAGVIGSHDDHYIPLNYNCHYIFLDGRHDRPVLQVSCSKTTTTSSVALAGNDFGDETISFADGIKNFGKFSISYPGYSSITNKVHTLSVDSSDVMVWFSTGGSSTSSTSANIMGCLDLDSNDVCDYLDDDKDGDGYDASVDDCDDNDASINPGATEVCDSVDNDCDGSVDEGCGVFGTYYRDLDGDGYGNLGNPIISFGAPLGYVGNNDDCDDWRASVHPGAVEICGNDIDEDCDGVADDGCTTPVDDDKDDDGYNASVDDCDDNDAAVNPGAIEICDDGVDNNCDGDIDEGCTTPVNDDVDGDGYNASVDDCDDNDAAVNPGMLEACDDGVDNNCDGDIDEGCGTTDSNAPVIDFFAPFDGQIFYGLPFVVDFVFGVNDQSDVFDCHVDINGESHTVINVNKSENNSLEVSLDEGNYSAMVFCADSFGNMGNGSEVLFGVEQFGTCSVDANCTDYYGERYCSGDDIYQTFHDLSCVGGSCVENVSEVFVKGCKDDCRSGKCRNDDDDDDDDDDEPVNFFVSRDTLVPSVIGVNASGDINLGTYASAESNRLPWVWLFLLIVGVVVLLFAIVWAGMD